MGLFKSKDERRIERDMKIRAGLKSIERAVRQQEKFTEDFIKTAQHAKRIGDDQQYLFVRNALKRTASVKKMLERQMLIMKNAMIISQQAQASQQVCRQHGNHVQTDRQHFFRYRSDTNSGPMGKSHPPSPIHGRTHGPDAGHHAKRRPQQSCG